MGRRATPEALGRTGTPRAGRTGAWPAAWLAALVAGIVAGGGACAVDCEGYVPCTTEPGLRWVACGVVHRFNDGTNLRDGDAAYGKCFCSVEDEPCADGRSLDVCFSAHYDGREGGFFSDGTRMEAGAAFAACRGFDTCEVVREPCDAPYYFLECRTATETAWLGSDGTVHGSRQEAEAACRVPGSSCRSAVASCTEGGSCMIGSRACSTYDSLDCPPFPECWEHTTQSSCDGDDACRWEG